MVAASLALLAAAAEAAPPLVLRAADMRLMDGELLGGVINADTEEEREATAMSKAVMIIIFARAMSFVIFCQRPAE